MGGRPAVAILIVPHDDPYAVESNRVERVFVGEVVADVHRQQGTRSVDAITNPGQRGPLVPVDVRPQLDYPATSRHPQAISLPEPVCCRDDLTDALRCDLAVVNRDGEALVLHAYPRNLRQTAAQLGGRALEDRHRGDRRVVLVITAVRSYQL